MLVASGALLFGMASALVVALGRDASESHDQWQLEDRAAVRIGR